MPVHTPGAVPKALESNKGSPGGSQLDQPPVTPPPVKNVPAPTPQLPNAPTVQPPAPAAPPQDRRGPIPEGMARTGDFQSNQPAPTGGFSRFAGGFNPANFGIPGGGSQARPDFGQRPIHKDRTGLPGFRPTDGRGAPPSLEGIRSSGDSSRAAFEQQFGFAPGQDPNAAPQPTGSFADTEFGRNQTPESIAEARNTFAHTTSAPPQDFQVTDVGGAPPPGISDAILAPEAPAFSRAAPASVGLQDIDPLNSLRGQEITPGQDPRLAGTRSDLDAAQGRVRDAEFEVIGPQDASTERAGQLLEGAAGEIDQARLGPQGAIAGTDVSGAQAGIERAQANIAGSALDTGASDITRDLALSQVQGLEGPNRQELAQRSFDLIGEQADRDFELNARDVGRKSATLGRIGSGVVTTELGTLAGDRERFLANSRERLGIETAGGQLDDQLKQLGATLGAGESFEGQALGRSGLGLTQASAESGLAAQREQIGRASRSEEVGERGFSSGQDALNAELALERSRGLRGVSGDTFGQGAAGRGEQRGERGAEFDQSRSQLSDLSALESQQFNEGAAERGEFRGEREFQDRLARGATDDAIRQIQLEDQIQNSGFNRENARLGQIGNAGFQGVGTSGFSNAANNLSQQSSNDTAFIGDLMAQAAANQGIPQQAVGQPVTSVKRTNPGHQGFS